MSGEVFYFVLRGSVKLLECICIATPTQRKMSLTVRRPQTQKSLNSEYFVTHGKADTLLSRDTSELLSVLWVRFPVNNCNVGSNGNSANAPQADRKASLRSSLKFSRA